MPDYGIKISKEGYAASDIPTEATKQNFIILDSTEAHKVFYKGYETSGSYTHNLGYRPFFFCFETDSAVTPTYFKPTIAARATTTQITSIPNPSYIIIFYEGE